MFNICTYCVFTLYGNSTDTCDNKMDARTIECPFDIYSINIISHNYNTRLISYLFVNTIRYAKGHIIMLHHIASSRIGQQHYLHIYNFFPIYSFLFFFCYIRKLLGLGLVRCRCCATCTAVITDFQVTTFSDFISRCIIDSEHVIVKNNVISAMSYSWGKFDLSHQVHYS